MSEFFGGDSQPGGAESFKVLEELELNRPEEIRSARGEISITVRSRITARPADLCDRESECYEGTSRELQRRSIFGVFDRPVPVGSVFHLTFDEQELDLPPAYAMCHKCAILKDDAFDVTFSFLTPVDPPVPRSGPAEG